MQQSAFWMRLLRKGDDNEGCSHQGGKEVQDAVYGVWERSMEP